MDTALPPMTAHATRDIPGPCAISWRTPVIIYLPVSMATVLTMAVVVIRAAARLGTLALSVKLRLMSVWPVAPASMVPLVRYVSWRDCKRECVCLRE